MSWETAFSLFAAFLAWAFAANILRITGTANLRYFLTLVVGFVALIGVHIVPIYLLGWLYGVALIIISYIISGALSGFYLAGYMRSVDWPENFGFQLRYLPAFMFCLSVTLLAIILVNNLP